MHELTVNRRLGCARPRLGVLVAVLLGTVAMLPASARADDLIVPHASQPHEVEVHPAPSAPPSAAPAPSTSGTPSPALTPSSDDGSGSEEFSDSDYDLPGSQYPSGKFGQPFPNGLSPYWACADDIGCLRDWFYYLTDREATVYYKDQEAAQELRDILADIKDMIRAESGIPDYAPVEAAWDGLPIPGQDQGADAGSQSGDASPIIGTVEVIFGDPTYLDGTAVYPKAPVDLGTWDLSGLISVADMVSGHWLVDAFNQIINGSTTCAKDRPDDEVAPCPN
jgi:hypothetical protein